MGFMTLEQELMAREYAGHESGLAEGEAKGREAGLAEGESRMKELVSRLIADGRLDDVKLLANDELDTKALFEEYGI